MMEIFLHGPGGVMTTHSLSDQAYEFWKDKSNRFLFDYSWNLDVIWKDHENKNHDNRTKLKIPSYADFLLDESTGDFQYWCQHGEQNRTVHLCDFNACVLFVEYNNKISLHYPEEFTTIEHDREYDFELNKFYSGVSCEIGNWQHKKYKKFIPLEHLILYTKKINGRKYIIDFGFDSSDMIFQTENYNMYEEMVVDWYYRLHVRNENVVKDLSTFSNVDLSYNLNSHTLHDEQEDSDIMDTSNFKIHNKIK